MKKNNRGFTLVELIICLAIFGILLVAVFGFMLTSAKTYNTINDRLELQLDAQLASNQISEYIIDCNDKIAFAGNTLSIKNKDTSISFTLEDGKLTLGTAKDLLIENVHTFNVALYDTDGKPVTAAIQGGDTKVGSAVLILELSLRSAVYKVEKTIALRNLPVYGR